MFVNVFSMWFATKKSTGKRTEEKMQQHMGTDNFCLFKWKKSVYKSKTIYSRRIDSFETICS